MALRNEATRRLRRRARHGALSALSWRADRQRFIRELLDTPRVHFAYLHNVPVHEEPDFRKLLDYLGEQHDLVSHSEAVRRIRSGSITRPTVSFSFDDGFASNHRTAAILEEYGTVGMFFIPGGFPGTPTLESARDFFGYSQSITEPAMSWEQIADLAARGHEIGNHTMTHRNLGAIPHPRVVEEINESAQVLRERLGGSRHFAWPFGRRHHIAPPGVSTAFATGHETCASAERGSHSASPAHTPPDAPMVLLRDHLMTSWPLEHNLYFLAKGAQRPTPPWIDYPKEWT